MVPIGIDFKVFSIPSQTIHTKITFLCNKGGVLYPQRNKPIDQPHGNENN